MRNVDVVWVKSTVLLRKFLLSTSPDLTKGVRVAVCYSIDGYLVFVYHELFEESLMRDKLLDPLAINSFVNIEQWFTSWRLWVKLYITVCAVSEVPV